MGVGMGVWEGAVCGGDRNRSVVSGTSMAMVAAGRKSVGATLSWQLGSSDHGCISFSCTSIPFRVD